MLYCVLVVVPVRMKCSYASSSACADSDVTIICEQSVRSCACAGSEYTVNARTLVVMLVQEIAQVISGATSNAHVG